MRNRYLLYIDILGFSDFVTTNSMQVRRIYRIIEDLNAHHHESFKVIVFSDTVLIYNLAEPLTSQDKNYYVMFLIEFAQNLLYEFSGKKLFFRALLVNGEFEHITSGRFEKYFGKALVRAYLKEKSIKCCGLFIDKESQKNNEIFPVAKYDKDVSFVYLNQSLDSFYRGELGEWPVDADLMYQTDSQWHLAQDIYFLHDVFTVMNKHRDDEVRQKMSATWNYYKKRYPKLILKLVNQDFDLSVLSNKFDWSNAVSRITEGYKGFSQETPSLNELRAIINEAKHKGSEAAKKCFEELYPEHESGRRYFSPCGGGTIILDIDGRSRLGRLLLSASNKIDGFTFRKSYSGGYIVCIRGMHSYQEQAISIAASHAALYVFQEHLGVIGHVNEYFS